jgi:hypothetical protein
MCIQYLFRIYTKFRSTNKCKQNEIKRKTILAVRALFTSQFIPLQMKYGKMLTNGKVAG